VAYRGNNRIERHLLAFEAGSLPEAQCGERIRTLGAKIAELRDRRTELADALDSTDRQPPSAQQIANTRLQVLAAIKGTDRAVGDGGADRIDGRRRTETGQPPGPQRPPTPSGPGHARRARPRRNR